MGGIDNCSGQAEIEGEGLLAEFAAGATGEFYGADGGFDESAGAGGQFVGGDGFGGLLFDDGEVKGEVRREAGVEGWVQGGGAVAEAGEMAVGGKAGEGDFAGLDVDAIFFGEGVVAA